MRANRLYLSNFRNYEEQSVEFSPGINVIFGDNAQGKTNILEAVHMFSLGKSNRTHRDSELIRHGETSAKIELEFEGGGREFEAVVEIVRNKGKSIKVNDIPVRRNSELIGRFNVVYFGPEYLGMVKEGPGKRRRNLDVLISQLKPAYFSALSDLRKIVESKNAILKMQNPNATMLGIMNEKLINISAVLIKYRSRYIKEIGEIAAEIQKKISGDKETLTVRYVSCIGAADGLDEAEIKRRMAEKIEKNSEREKTRMETLISPHRDDIIYEINGKEAKAYASQGQQKTIVLVEKLAEVELISREIGESPVLLLDDIMSELDKKRQAFILSNIKGMQIIITCTDIEEFGNLDNFNRIYVENAVISAKGYNKPEISAN